MNRISSIFLKVLPSILMKTRWETNKCLKRPNVLFIVLETMMNLNFRAFFQINREMNVKNIQNP